MSKYKAVINKMDDGEPMLQVREIKFFPTLGEAIRYVDAMSADGNSWGVVHEVEVYDGPPPAPNPARPTSILLTRRNTRIGE